MTLTGKGTFHGMGIISIQNGGNRELMGRIPRLKERQPAAFADNKRGLKIIPYEKTLRQLQKRLVIKPLKMSEKIQVKSSTSFLSLLWHFGGIPSIERP